MNSKLPVDGIILGALGGLAAIGALALFIKDRIFLCVICIVFAMLFFAWAKTAFSKAKAADDTNAFLKYGAEAKKFVDSVIEAGDSDNIINSASFAGNGLKAVVVDNYKRIALVLTKECIYEGIFSGYDFPAKGIQNIKFEKGQEIEGSQRVMMDEGKMARAGLMAGGLGVAAMNYASAKEANAQGGAVVGVKSGFFRFNLKVRSEETPVYVIVIRKDYINKFGNIFGDCYFKEGKYFNAYYIQNIKGAAACKEACEKMTGLLSKIQKA